MGKRKKERDYDYIARKLRKLEKKLYRKHRSRSSSSFEEDVSPSRYEYYQGEAMQEVEELESDNCSMEPIQLMRTEDPIALISTADPIPSTSTIEPIPSTSATNPIPFQGTTTPLPNLVENEKVTALTNVHPSIELDSEILQIFGEDPSIERVYAKEIQSDLAIRLQHVATKGLSTEVRKELIEKYLPPSNCTLIDSPALNLEIKAATSDIVLKRDKSIEIKQKQMGCAISCLAGAITVMISKENKDTEVIKMLMDSIRLLCDNQHADTIVRRNFILNNLKKEMKEQLQKTAIDKHLFGSDLAETLKIAKTISKTGAELKSTVSRPPVTRTKTVPPPNQSTSQPRNNLNWRAPPPSRRQTGTQRTREPAHRNPPANASRGSYRARQAAPAHRNYRSRR